MKRIALLFVVAVGCQVQAQPISAGIACESRPNKPTPTTLQTEQSRKLAELAVCSGKTLEESSACNIFTGKALKLLFGLNDFMANPEEPTEGYLTANVIADRLRDGKIAGWETIPISGQAALTEAAKRANQGQAVVAVKSAAGHGHVANILAGTPETAADRYEDGKPNKWKGLTTPNAASFFLAKEDKGFIGCPLHYVWAGGPADVRYYSKKVQ